MDDKSYRPLLTASSANQSECNIEQEDCIVYKMEGYAVESTSVQSWAPPLLFITLFVRRNLIGCPGIPGRLIVKA